MKTLSAGAFVTTILALGAYANPVPQVPTPGMTTEVTLCVERNLNKCSLFSIVNWQCSELNVTSRKISLLITS